MRYVFFGSADFSVDVLRSLKEDFFPVGIVTAPDKARGRGLKTKPNPVAVWASDNGISHTKVVRSVESLPYLAKKEADLIVVAAWGEILPIQVLSALQYGSINIHASLLPKYRGATPIQQAILEGEAQTGVSIMQMDEGLDTGPVYRQSAINIEPRETTGSLSSRLAKLGADELIHTLQGLPKIKAVPQDGTPTYTHRISSEDAQIDWSTPAEQIDRKIRAMNPAPGAWTTVDGKRVKVWDAEVSTSKLPTGSIKRDAGLLVGTSTAALRLTLVQPGGSRPMSGDEFLNGYRGILSRFA